MCCRLRRARCRLLAFGLAVTVTVTVTISISQSSEPEEPFVAGVSITVRSEADATLRVAVAMGGIAPANLLTAASGVPCDFAEEETVLAVGSAMPVIATKFSFPVLMALRSPAVAVRIGTSLETVVAVPTAFPASNVPSLLY